MESFVKEKITWLGHASFRIDGPKSTIDFDPWKLKSSKPVDVVCITHFHCNHLPEEDVDKIRKPSTVIVGVPDCKVGFGEAFKAISPGKSLQVGDVTVEAVPAYNTDKNFHPKRNTGWDTSSR